MANQTKSRPLSKIDTLTEATFDNQVIEATEPVVVNFMTYGCVHCRMIEPILEEMAGSPSFRPKMFRVNIAAEKALAERFEIEGTPTFVMFMDGQTVGRCEGPSPTVQNLTDLFDQAFGLKNGNQ